MKKIEFFRSNHPQFLYNNYSYELKGKNLHIAFEFAVPPKIHFQPTLVIHGVTKKDLQRVGKDVVDNLLFNFGMYEILSH